MKMRWNPIVKKDLQVGARSMRLSWGLFAYEIILVLAFLMALAIIQSSYGGVYSDGNIYASLVYLFPILAGTQAVIVALIMPILTASSISGEKERQTFDIMLTTCMSPFSIVWGKVVSAVIRILFFVAGSLPIMALSFVVGGLSWLQLLYFLLVIIMLSLFSGSIGIMCSSFCRKSITAVIMSFVIYAVIYGGSFVPMIFMYLITYGDYAGESMLFLLGNPIMFFEEYFMYMLTGESLMSEAYFDLDEVGIITYLLSQGPMWIIASVICIVALSFLFLAIAAWRVNPMNGLGGTVKKKKKSN
ncbi:MAG: ABC transporter permease subunit [Lachnospiraceae bacterium]|nr:ABC transporter permease subunit [Lachnospiraceae bacterium]